MNKVQKRRLLRKEVLRKFVHLLELPVLLGYTVVSAMYGFKIGILVLTALLIILLEIEFIRLQYRLRLPAVIDILRRKEKDNVAGNIFFVASTIICFAAFDYPIALLALLYAVFGDMAAALIGRRWGKTKIVRNKTIEGFIGGFLMNLLVGYIIMYGDWQIFIPMALAASIVELGTGKLDDNLTVPLAAGFIGQMLVFVWQTGLTSFPGPFITWLIGLLPL